MLKKLLSHDADPTKLDVSIASAAAVVAVLKAVDKILTYKKLNPQQGAK